MVIWLAVAACGKSGDGRPAPDQVAGEVVEVAGDVQIEQGGATTAAVVGAKVHGADTIITGADGRVTVLLYHNRARWALDGGKRKRVDQSVAWRAPKSAGGSLLAEGAGDQGTSAAGRHAEKEAADTRATARADEATPEPTMPPPAAAADMAPPAEPTGAVEPPPPPPPRPAPAKRHSAKHRSSGRSRTMQKMSDGSNIVDQLGGDTGGLGNVGTLGKGGGGGNGSGYGAGAGEKEKAPAPTVTAGAPKAVGKLDPAIINRIIRQHRPQIRHCYDLALANNPKLAGKIAIDFVIDPKGKVVKATASGDSAMVSAIGRCTTRAFRTFAFPAPEGGGIVTVSYPLAFAPPN